MAKIKTWPALMEQVAGHQRQTLAKSALRFSRTSSEKPIRTHLVGILLELTHEEAGTILYTQLMKEEEEHLAMCKKYNEFGLTREAIIKTSFFKEILRKADLAKEFFTFTSFDDKYVRANLQHLSTSEEYFRRIQNLRGYFQGIKSMKDFTKVRARELVREIRDQMIEDLWPHRTDETPSAGTRWIEVDFPVAPERTKLRLIEWAKKGFIPKMICHKAGIRPYLREQHFEDVLDAIVTILIQLYHEQGEDIGRMLNFREELRDQMVGLDGVLLKDDPILFIEDGEWTVVIDQYSALRKEREVIEVVKSHYMLLKEKYKILDEKN